jgi:hypothetical protein
VSELKSQLGSYLDQVVERVTVGEILEDVGETTSVRPVQPPAVRRVVPGWLYGVAAALVILLAGVIGVLLRGGGNGVVDQAPPTTLDSPTAANGWVAYATWPRPGEGGEIFIVKEGEPARAIVPSGGDLPLGRCPTFSPDGSMLAYTTHPASVGGGLERNVMVLSLDPDSLMVDTVLATPAPQDDSACVQWSPDGTMLAFRDGRSFAVVDTTGNRRELNIPQGAVVQPSWMAPGRLRSWAWTPDSAAITTAYESALWSIPLDGGSPVLVTDSETLFGFEHHLNAFQWSSDGRELLVSFSIEPENDGSGPVVEDTFFIGRVRLDGSEEVRDILPGDDPRWSPNGEWIFYLGPAAGDSLTIDQSIVPRLIDVATGEVRTLDLGSGETYGHVWSPDSTRLVYTGRGGELTPGIGLISQVIESGSRPVILVEATGELDYTGGWGLDNEISWQAALG